MHILASTTAALVQTECMWEAFAVNTSPKLSALSCLVRSSSLDRRCIERLMHSLSLTLRRHATRRRKVTTSPAPHPHASLALQTSCLSTHISASVSPKLNSSKRSHRAPWPLLLLTAYALPRSPSWRFTTKSIPESLPFVEAKTARDFSLSRPSSLAVGRRPCRSVDSKGSPPGEEDGAPRVTCSRTIVTGSGRVGWDTPRVLVRWARGGRTVVGPLGTRLRGGK